MPKYFIYTFLLISVIFIAVGGVLLFNQDEEINEQREDIQSNEQSKEDIRRSPGRDLIPKDDVEVDMNVMVDQVSNLVPEDNIESYTVIADNLEIPWTSLFYLMVICW